MPTARAAGRHHPQAGCVDRDRGILQETSLHRENPREGAPSPHHRPHVLREESPKRPSPTAQHSQPRTMPSRDKEPTLCGSYELSRPLLAMHSRETAHSSPSTVPPPRKANRRSGDPLRGFYSEPASAGTSAVFPRDISETRTVLESTRLPGDPRHTNAPTQKLKPPSCRQTVSASPQKAPAALKGARCLYKEAPTRPPKRSPGSYP